ncbi:cellulose biosynthesis cyclic di-GMP-binding regulatory protein BcsB [Herbaspirillum sp. RV1423]|uniref:cellulose biosynthesis cyclic di-GMP-binding regulatory protein BcsB n=1 Tax=Herbaspirillum sp. RV1423 TaxID=1443993 RepID=UPI0004B03BE3|nr:cellulose biosynthesis cyclic di-GMP-binding regulatory protein BcsB [Herbaspirillum sp. RV1423]
MKSKLSEKAGPRNNKRFLSVLISTLLVSSGVPVQADTPQAGTGNGYSLTLKQLGRNYPISLHGVESTDSVNFDVPASQVATGAQVTLQYSYSPALLPDVSQINVMVNDVVAASIPLLKKDAGSLQTQKVDIPAKLITEFNRLSMQFIGHYTMGCEDPTHTSLWAKIGNDSVLDIQTSPLALKNDLAIMPLPFFDRRDIHLLNLPFIFASTPNNGTLEAAGTLSSWFGALASYRGATFPIQLNALPVKGNGVILVSGDAASQIGGLSIPAPKGPTLTIVTNPNDPNGKLLVVAGRDVAELKRAAIAVSIGGKALAGSSAVIDKLDTIKPRKPYDAPNWLPTDHVVKLGDLIDAKRLNVSGYNPGDITIPLNFPPDLSSWRQDGALLNLTYRYTPQPKSTNSSFIVSFNDGLIKSDTLPSKERLDKGLLSTIKGDTLVREMSVRLPLNAVALQSRLQLRYMYDYIKQGECGDIIIDNVRGSIDPESTLDLTGYDHFMAMPNLGVFKDAGFPFTRMADLSETAVVLPDNPSTGDLSAYLTILGRFGNSTGYPATGVTVTQADQVAKFAGKDFLVMASGANQPLLKQWADRLPTAVTGEKQRFELSDLAVRARTWFNADSEETQRKARLSMAFAGGEATSYLTGFESPLASGRSVVVVAGGDAQGLTQVAEALSSSDVDAGAIQGSLVAVRGKTVEALLADEQYFVGSMSPIRYARWWLSRHVGWMFLITAVGVALLAGLAYLGLRAKARKRLKV